MSIGVLEVWINLEGIFCYTNYFACVASKGMPVANMTLSSCRVGTKWLILTVFSFKTLSKHLTHIFGMISITMNPDSSR